MGAGLRFTLDVLDVATRPACGENALALGMKQDAMATSVRKRIMVRVRWGLLGAGREERGSLVSCSFSRGWDSPVTFFTVTS